MIILYTQHTYEELRRIIIMLIIDEHKASGPDYISPYILKYCTDKPMSICEELAIVSAAFLLSLALIKGK